MNKKTSIVLFLLLSLSNSLFARIQFDMYRSSAITLHKLCGELYDMKEIKKCENSSIKLIRQFVYKIRKTIWGKRGLYKNSTLINPFYWSRNSENHTQFVRHINSFHKKEDDVLSFFKMLEQNNQHDDDLLEKICMIKPRSYNKCGLFGDSICSGNDILMINEYQGFIDEIYSKSKTKNLEGKFIKSSSSDQEKKILFIGENHCDFESKIDNLAMIEKNYKKNTIILREGMPHSLTERLPPFGFIYSELTGLYHAKNMSMKHSHYNPDMQDFENSILLRFLFEIRNELDINKLKISSVEEDGWDKVGHPIIERNESLRKTVSEYAKNRPVIIVAGALHSPLGVYLHYGQNIKKEKKINSEDLVKYLSTDLKGMNHFTAGVSDIYTELNNFNPKYIIHERVAPSFAPSSAAFVPRDLLPAIKR